MRIFFAMLCGMLLLPVFSVSAAESPAEIEKNMDISRLDDAILSAKTRIADLSKYHAKDFLQLLPSVSVSRRATSDAFTSSSNETYIGLSVNSSQLWNISDRASNREAVKAHALRQIDSNRFLIRTLIDRKFLLKERAWKFAQMRLSLDNPVEIASLDEKIDEIAVKIQECEITMEKAFAEIEFVVVEAGL